MTELYIRILPIEPWRKAAWLKDADADGMAEALRQEGYRVAMVHLPTLNPRRTYDPL